MATGRRQIKKKYPEEKSELKVFDFNKEDAKKDLSGSEDDVKEDNTPKVDKSAKKRPAADFEEDGAMCAMGNEVQSMLDKFGADISKVMQAKRKRLESLTKNYMKGSQHKLEQLWSTHHNQRQRMTQQYSQQVSTALQQWEAEAQRAEEQEEQLNSLFRQQQKILQQARVVQKQKLQTVRELYEQFVKVRPLTPALTLSSVFKRHITFCRQLQEIIPHKNLLWRCKVPPLPVSTSGSY
ncbi:synaptonemal complex protein 3 [Plectropomus leopardus]|uniref:synaptonemal complex protein 3 n=1 Tax=Plectropomus leopardus TaxID=160734 RepID=UPI001C4C8923|nr:synaptonemal complex protein 3 [Plectropomus leopardus]